MSACSPQPRADEATLSEHLPPGEPGRRPRPTIREVAALAGVSLKTVSRVVNEEAGVSADLADRVQEAINRLGYQRNLSASSLRRSDGKTATIGVLLKNVANPFSASIHRAVEEVARRRGVAVLAGSVDEDPVRERELIEAFSARRVDGLIIVPAGQDHSYLVDERRAGTALVFVDRPPSAFDADCVLTDNRAGAAAGVRHLIERGHRRIAFLGDLRTITTAVQRCEGYRDAIETAGLPIDDRLVVLDLHSDELARDAVRALMTGDSPPTALFAGQNLITIGAHRALRELALQHRIALVGFDDFLLADLLEPGVTVVAQHPSAMGELAAEELFRRMDGDRSPTRRHVVPTTLIERGSGEIAP